MYTTDIIMGTPLSFVYYNNIICSSVNSGAVFIMHDSEPASLVTENSGGVRQRRNCADGDVEDTGIYD